MDDGCRWADVTAALNYRHGGRERRRKCPGAPARLLAVELPDPPPGNIA